MRYDVGATHPMHPGWLETTMALARELGVLARPTLRVVRPRPGSDDVLALVHDPRHVAAVRGAPRREGVLAVQDSYGLDNPVFDAGVTVDAAQAVRTVRSSTASTSRAAYITPCLRGRRGSVSQRCGRRHRVGC